MFASKTHVLKGAQDGQGNEPCGDVAGLDLGTHTFGLSGLKSRGWQEWFLFGNAPLTRASTVQPGDYAIVLLNVGSDACV